MIEQEDSQLTSFHRYPQITTAYRAAISENNLKSSRRFSTIKDNQGDTYYAQKQQKCSLVRTNVLSAGTGNSQLGRKSQLQRSSLRPEGSQSHIRVPKEEGALHQKGNLPNISLIAKLHSTLRLHGLQHARLPCLSLSPRVCSNTSVELVMSSNHVIVCHAFSSCPQSFPASGFFQ